MRPENPAIPDKLYFRIGEVSKIVGVPPHVLRFWETEFRRINPKRTPTGQRLYNQREVHLILEIKHLLYDKGYTIKGARRRLRRAEGSWTGEETSLLEELRDELRRLRELLG